MTVRHWATARREIAPVLATGLPGIGPAQETGLPETVPGPAIAHRVTGDLKQAIDQHRAAIGRGATMRSIMSSPPGGPQICNRIAVRPVSGAVAGADPNFTAAEVAVDVPLPQEVAAVDVRQQVVAVAAVVGVDGDDVEAGNSNS